MRFKERPILLDGKALGCVGNTNAPDEACYHLCTNGGRYCHPSHHGNVGRDIVKESLRRLCIDKHYKSSKVYWDYIDHFNSRCWDTDRPGGGGLGVAYLAVERGGVADVAPRPGVSKGVQFARARNLLGSH